MPVGHLRGMRSLLAWLALLAATPALADHALLQELRGGGHVIFLRHTETGPAWPDQRQALLGDCDTQRDLNAAGRADARAIGQAIAELGIPVDAVLASPYCRAMETAVLAFGQAQPEWALNLPSDTLSPMAHAVMGFELRRLLAARPPGAGNLVLVGHSYHVAAAFGPLPEPQGAAVVIGPAGARAMIGPHDWPRLAVTKAKSG